VNICKFKCQIFGIQFLTSDLFALLAYYKDSQYIKESKAIKDLVHEVGDFIT